MGERKKKGTEGEPQQAKAHPPHRVARAAQRAADLRDGAAFVVPAQQRDAVGVADFEREQQQEGLDAVEAAVDKVAQKEVVVLGDGAADLKELHEVVVLAVNVAANLRRGSGRESEPANVRGGMEKDSARARERERARGRGRGRGQADLP